MSFESTAIQTDPECACSHNQLHHAADQGFCYYCDCRVYAPSRDEHQPKKASDL